MYLPAALTPRQRAAEKADYYHRLYWKYLELYEGAAESYFEAQAYAAHDPEAQEQLEQMNLLGAKLNHLMAHFADRWQEYEVQACEHCNVPRMCTTHRRQILDF